MEGNTKSKPRVLMIFGAPCSGKTTFGEKFAKKFGLAFYDLNELKNKEKFTKKNILTIIELLTRTKQTFLLEGELSKEKERSEIREILEKAGYNPSLVWIQTDVATIRSRLKMRHRNINQAKQVYEKAVSEMEAPEDAERPIILSGKHTFETQAKHVIAGLADLSDTK